MKILILFLALFATASWAADNQCGLQAGGLANPCEEAICTSPDVIECSDWNDNSFDGWSVASGRYSNGGELGDLLPNVGLNGTPGWEHKIRIGNPRTMSLSKNRDMGFGPVHFRTYIKFSEGYQHEMICGLQKLFYVSARPGGTLTHRIMVGVTAARDLQGLYSSLDNTIGIIGFDYRGHIVKLPKQPEDSPTLIYPNRWYSIEVMVHYVSANENTVKLWIDGKHQMTRENYPDSYFDGSPFSSVQETAWFGGADSCAQNTQDQFVWYDNTVISSSYIGPIPSLGPPGPPYIPQP